MASISTAIFDELLTTVEVIGIESTIKALQEAKSKSLILQDLDIDFVYLGYQKSFPYWLRKRLVPPERNKGSQILVDTLVFRLNPKTVLELYTPHLQTGSLRQPLVLLTAP